MASPTKWDCSYSNICNSYYLERGKETLDCGFIEMYLSTGNIRDLHIMEEQYIHITWDLVSAKWIFLGRPKIQNSKDSKNSLMP